MLVTGFRGREEGRVKDWPTEEHIKRNNMERGHIIIIYLFLTYIGDTRLNWARDQLSENWPKYSFSTCVPVYSGEVDESIKFYCKLKMKKQIPN